MDSDAEEIWRDRLRKDVDVTKIKDKQTLLDEIDKTPDEVTLISKKGKVYTKDLTEAKANLKEFIGDLISGSDSLQDTFIENNIKDLETTTTSEGINRIVIRVIENKDIDSDKRDLFRNEGALRERQTAGENLDILTRDDFLKLGFAGTSLKKSAGRISASQENLQKALEREGFTITENNRIKK